MSCENLRLWLGLDCVVQCDAVLCIVLCGLCAVRFIVINMLWTRVRYVAVIVRYGCSPVHCGWVQFDCAVCCIVM